MGHNTTQSLSFNEASSSVQAHLGIMQNVIARMAANSTACKTWCITIVSAILVVVADKQNPQLVWITVFPIIFFGALDIYYLALEGSFINSYNSFIEKLHNSSLTIEDLYSIKPIGKQNHLQWEAAKSFSVWGFYVCLIVLVWFVKSRIIPC